MFNDFKRITDDPIGSVYSHVLDPLDQVGAGGKVTVGGDISRALGFANDGSGYPKTLSMKQIQDFMSKGRKRAEGLTGTTSKEVGQKRDEIRGRYEDVVNAPSRGVGEVNNKRDADERQLVASQRANGIQGPMADLQRIQLRTDYAKTAGDVRQREYLEALNKLETQYRGAASDIMKGEGQYGALAVGGQPSPQAPMEQGMTYVCTELRKRGLISGVELFFIHAMLLLGIFFRPVATLTYLKHGRKVVNHMNWMQVDWRMVKDLMYNCVMHYIKRGRFLAALDIYASYMHEYFVYAGVDLSARGLWRSLIAPLESSLIVFKIVVFGGNYAHRQKEKAHSQNGLLRSREGQDGWWF